MKRRLYYNGPILTMDKANPRAEAVLTENGAIVAVGDYREVESLAAEAERVDLQGRTLMPGFVDGHGHMIETGLREACDCDLTGCTCYEEILERICRFREKNNLIHGETIRAIGYDLGIMKEDMHPTAALLDSLGFDNPIACVHISGHMGSYNTVALKKAGITDETYVCPEGGSVGRDEHGKLNGYFEEAARVPLFRMYDRCYNDEELKKGCLTAQEIYLKYGYTTVQDGGRNIEQRLDIITRMAEEKQLKLDVVFYLNSEDSIPLWEKALEQWGRDYRNHLKIGGVKLALDGSPQARTAWMLEPYEGESEYRGYPISPDEKVEQMISNALDYDMQVLAHCNGSAASEQFVSSWERVSARKKKGQGTRPVMVHCQTVTYDQLDRMKAIGMMPTFFINHCYYWGDTHIKNFGERGYRISPMKQALDRGIVCSMHQDSPVIKPNMLESIWCAVNRITSSGVCVGEENRIDCYDALIAATNGGAYTYFEEEKKGILKSGAIADFVILDKDPTAVPPMEIKDIQVLATIKEDEVLYQKGKEGQA